MERRRSLRGALPGPSPPGALRRTAARLRIGHRRRPLRLIRAAEPRGERSQPLDVDVVRRLERRRVEVGPDPLDVRLTIGRARWRPVGPVARLRQRGSGQCDGDHDRGRRNQHRGVMFVLHPALPRHANRPAAVPQSIATGHDPPDVRQRQAPEQPHWDVFISRQASDHLSIRVGAQSGPPVMFPPLGVQPVVMVAYEHSSAGENRTGIETAT